MQAKAKIKRLEALAGELDALRADDDSRIVVHCHGVFDLLHIGHIRHFEEAKSLGDLLVVTLTSDRHVNKGPDRPAFTEDLRAEAVAALDSVDFVAINSWPTAIETVKLLRPNVYAKGPDYRDRQADVTGHIVEEEKAVESVGGRVVITDDVVFSSSTLINRYLPVVPEEVREYLSGFSERHSLDEVLRYIETARTLKVLVVGEAILDEYHYCEMIGKSAKEPVLAARFVSSEKFAGGILAVANDVANFCDDVAVVAMLGTEQPQEDFVRRELNSNVEPMLFYKRNSPTIVKRRFIEGYLLQKLFEIYEINDEELDSSQSSALCEMLRNVVPRYDVVIVVDYGHGMLMDDVVEMLSSQARFLAVNTQANAGNRGFNTISKYPRADYVSLAYHEITLEERNRRRNLKDMVLSVADKLNCGSVTVTLGKNGNVCYSRKEGFFEVPAFASQVVDRVGAGDAVMALTALCAAQQAPAEIVGLIGNVAGAQAVATMGHGKSIQRAPFLKHLESLLK